MILIIFEVISIIVVVIGCRVLRDLTLVCGPLHTWQPSLFQRYFLNQNVVITHEYDFDDNWKIQ